MAALSIQVPYPVFYDRDGQPLDNGNIYIGVANLDPVTNPLQVYYDESLTIPASQPLKTSNGYIYRNGTPAQLYVNAVNFSILVNDEKNLLVYSFPDGTGISPNAAGIIYNEGSVGAVDRTVESRLQDYVSVKDFGAVGDGVTNDTAAIQAANAVGTSIYFPEGTYLLGSNTTLTSDIAFAQGAEISVPLGVTLTINASVTAEREIFDGAGTVDLDGSPTGYNLSWFKTTNGYINERFDFAKRGMTSFNNKIIRIPHPYSGQAGSSLSGTRNFWLFNAPLLFTDKQNTSKVYVEGEFLAAGNCAAFMEFNDALKPESIFFYGAIQAQATASQVVGVGIDIKSGARIQFFCNIVLNGFQTSMRIGSPDMVAGVGDIYAPMLQLSFFYARALLIYGVSGSANSQGIYLGQVNATSAQSAGLNAVEIGGLVRTVNIEEIFYATDVPKDGYAAVDAANVVQIFSDDTHLLMAHINIGGIYQANANNCLKITSTASVPAAADIRFITVNRIFGKFNGGAADINYCQYVTINGIENFSDATIGANAAYTTLNTNNGAIRTLTNNGSFTLVNGVGTLSSGGGAAPNPAVEFPIGSFVRETGDNRVYLRIAKAGAATDYIMVRGALRGSTGNRPTLTTTDVGQLYLDTTLDADGKPIWWNGTAWVDATGAVV